LKKAAIELKTRTPPALSVFHECAIQGSRIGFLVAAVQVTRCRRRFAISLEYLGASAGFRVSWPQAAAIGPQMR